MIEVNEIDVLLVEDNHNDAELALRSLKKHNLANNVLWVKDGAEALDYVFGNGSDAVPHKNDSPKLILLDLKLPKVNGKEVLQKLKTDQQASSIPVVVMTSSNDDRDIEECYRLGANSYVTKPVEFEKFAKVVAELGFYWLLLNEVS
ncbi:MAG: response regulator [Actinobacteria bacterium]|nr:response regulator [Actinomycetota bacterium]